MTGGEAGGQEPSPALLTLAPSAGKESGEEASSPSSARSPRPHKLLNRVLPLRPLSALPDDRLVEMTRAGSERAFEALAARYRRQLLIYAERLLGAESRAEDALQQAFLQAWLALRGGAEVADPRPWLYRIVHNCAVSTIRRARHECVALSEQLDAPATDAGPEPRLVLGEIFDHLALMPEPQREALVMTAIAGRTHEEAAAALGLTDGAVRGLVYRARSALRHAAAAVFPPGLWHWLSRRQSLAPDGADAAGAAGSAGVAAALAKGSALVATAGVIAGAGHGLLTSSPIHHSPRTVHRLTAAHAATTVNISHARTSPLLPAAVAASQVTVAEQRGAGNQDRHGRSSGERGDRGRTSGSSGGGHNGSGRRGSDGGGHGSGSSDGGDVRSVSGGGGPGPSSGADGDRSGDSGSNGHSGSGSDPTSGSGSDSRSGSGSGSGSSGGSSSGGSSSSGSSADTVGKANDGTEGGPGPSGGLDVSESPAAPPQPEASTPSGTDGGGGSGPWPNGGGPSGGSGGDASSGSSGDDG